MARTLSDPVQEHIWAACHGSMGTHSNLPLLPNLQTSPKLKYELPWCAVPQKIGLAAVNEQSQQWTNPHSWMCLLQLVGPLELRSILLVEQRSGWELAWVLLQELPGRLLWFGNLWRAADASALMRHRNRVTQPKTQLVGRRGKTGFVDRTCYRLLDPNTALAWTHCRVEHRGSLDPMTPPTHGPWLRTPTPNAPP